MTRELKGWHVAAMFCFGFSIIIAVNLTLAFNAVATFPGLEVGNSYVASQQFEERRAAQQALGWTAEAEYDGAAFTLSLTDTHALPAAVAKTGRWGARPMCRRMLRRRWSLTGLRGARRLIWMPAIGRCACRRWRMTARSLSSASRSLSKADGS